MALPTIGTITTDAASTFRTSTSITHTVDTGNNLYLYVAISAKNESVTSVAWDTAGVNESLTLIGTSQVSNVRLAIYGLTGPTAGASKTLTAVHSGGRICITAISFKDVDQTTPYSNFGLGTQSSFDIDWTGMTSNANTMLVAAAAQVLSATYTPKSTATEFHTDLLETSTNTTLTTFYDSNKTSIGTTSTSSAAFRGYALELNGATGGGKDSNLLLLGVN